MAFSLSKIATAIAVLACALAVVIPYIQSTVWWAGYDLQNCPGCRPIINWSEEHHRTTVTPEHIQTFEEDGVVVLSSAISHAQVSALASEVESLSDTFMTTVLPKVVLKQYSKYEHKLDTRSELIRDWAIHGPLGKWAAQLMNVSEVRLYNCEKIYSNGNDNPNGCATAWHRDTVAAPFPMDTQSITFNVYLDDIGADGPHGDALIYVKGSHLNLNTPPKIAENIFEPHLKVGDVLAHAPHIYHTPSGRGCWRRRSLQFRYVASPTIFTFRPNRLPHGPIPWTFAHAADVAPHGLKEGEALEGQWYPKVYPEPLESEHVAIEGTPWGIMRLLGVAKEAQDIAKELGIGHSENCTIDASATAAGGAEGSSEKEPAYFGFDGPVTSCEDWDMLGGVVPVHRNGQMIKTMHKMMTGSDEKKGEISN